MGSRKENFWIGLMVAVVLSPISYYLPKGPGYSVMVGSSLLISVFSFFVAPRYVKGFFLRGNTLFGEQKEGSRDALFAHAQTFIISGNFEQALAVYLEIITVYPDEVLAYRSMLDILCGTFNDYERAEKEFRKGLRGVRDKRVQQTLFAVYNEATKRKDVDLIPLA